MPSAALRACAGRCGALVLKGRCPACSLQKGQAYDRTRESSSKRGYDSRWQHWRAAVIRGYRLRLCGDRPSGAPQTADSVCKAQGRVVAGHELDHIQLIDGPDDPRRLDKTNVQYLCSSCHAAKRGRESHA